MSNISNDTTNSEVVEAFPRAGEIKRTIDPPFSSILAHFEQKGRGNLYYPFKDVSEWETAVWLKESGLPLTEVDKFLNLPSVRVTCFTREFTEI